MALSYFEFEQNRVYQPYYRRHRETYRGPRRSRDINLETNQMLLDINKINDLYDELRTSLSYYTEYFYYTADNNELIDHYIEFDDGPTPVLAAVNEGWSFKSLNARLSRMEDKLKRLESSL